VGQPITTRPELTSLNAGGTDYTLVEFGTGRYLGNTDRANTDLQSVYAIKDYPALGTGWGTLRSRGDMVQQTLSSTTGANGQLLRTTSTSAVNWATKAGWYLDLATTLNPSPGERVNVDVQLTLGSLTVATNVPSENSCTVGGYGFIYNFDFKSGTYLVGATSNTAGTKLSSNALVAGMNTIKLQSGKIVTIITDTSGGITSVDTPSTGGGGGVAKRISWRELTT
jgi:type IV pilus assembly protein PilY1